MFAFSPGTKDERCVLTCLDAARPPNLVGKPRTTDPFELDTTLDGILTIPGGGDLKPIQLAVTISGGKAAQDQVEGWRLRRIEIAPRFVVSNATLALLEMQV